MGSHRHSVRRALGTFCAAALLLASTLLFAPFATASHADRALRFARLDAHVDRLSANDPRFKAAPSGFRLRGGVAVISSDQPLYRIRRFKGVTASGHLSDGRAIVLWPGVRSATEVRVADTAEAAGQETHSGPPPPPPAWVPTFPGYDFVVADRDVGNAYLGLWNRSDGKPELLIVSFDGSAHAGNRRAPVKIGRLPFRGRTISLDVPLHGISWEVTITTEASPGRPVHFLHYQWFPRETAGKPLRSRSAT
jgi:hypothetical protein